MVMANRDDLKRKREADQRTALLALAADRQSKTPGSCLTSQEMSILIDGKCESELHQSFLTHLSSCDSCYKEWLELSRELSTEENTQRKPFLFRRKFLTVSGSLLAAAASVVFYINLDHAPGPQKMSVPASTPAPVQLEMKTETVEDKEYSIQARQMESPPSSSVSVKNILPQAMEMKTESVIRAEKKKPIRTMDSAAMLAPDPRRLWLKKLEEKCNNPFDTTIVSWELLAEQGEKLTESGQSSKLQRIAELVNQLAQGQEQQHVCMEIKRIVEEKTSD